MALYIHRYCHRSNSSFCVGLHKKRCDHHDCHRTGHWNPNFKYCTMDTTTLPKKVGIYSGSFNPIHIGHLALANWLCEYTPLDEIWFLVTPQNPFKSETELMNDEFRLELVQYAIANSKPAILNFICLNPLIQSTHCIHYRILTPIASSI